jgi:hypothetical protein
VTGVQTCALPICRLLDDRRGFAYGMAAVLAEALPGDKNHSALNASWSGRLGLGRGARRGQSLTAARAKTLAFNRFSPALRTTYVRHVNLPDFRLHREMLRGNYCMGLDCDAAEVTSFSVWSACWACC